MLATDAIFDMLFLFTSQPNQTKPNQIQSAPMLTLTLPQLLPPPLGRPPRYSSCPRQTQLPLLPSPRFPCSYLVLGGAFLGFPPSVCSLSSLRSRWSLKATVTPMGWVANQVVNDVFMSGVASGVALALLRFWEEMATRGVFKQVVNRKLVHISIGLAFMLFWPFFSYGPQAPFLAALAPGINIIRMLLLGSGIWKNEALVRSMSRSGDYRELLKGPLYYACTITLAATIFWRTSPVAIAAICNLCAGDGVADIIGRKFGREKLPYNQNKSFMGTIAMAVAGFVASLMYMHYFSLFGLIEERWDIILGFLLVSLVAAIIESLPISTELDDNLTVPLVSVMVGCFVF